VGKAAELVWICVFAHGNTGPCSLYSVSGLHAERVVFEYRMVVKVYYTLFLVIALLLLLLLLM